MQIIYRIIFGVLLGVTIGRAYESICIIIMAVLLIIFAFLSFREEMSLQDFVDILLGLVLSLITGLLIFVPLEILLNHFSPPIQATYHMQLIDTPECLGEETENNSFKITCKH